MTPEERARRKLLEEFQRTALDRIARINVLWIGLESDPGDDATAEELLRELHTLKGEARMMGFSEVSLLVHRMEEIAVRARQWGEGLPQELGDLVMDASDAAGRLLQQGGGALAPAGDLAVDLAGLLERFDRILEGGGGEPRPAPAEAPARMWAQEPAAAWQRPDEDFLRVDAAQVAAFSESTFELRVRARRVAQQVRRILEVLAGKRARLAELERGDVRTIRTMATMATMQSMQSMQSMATAGLPGAGAERAAARRPAAELAELADLLNRLLPLCTGLRQEAEESEILLHELDAQVRSLRLVPIATLFERYVRLIRDLARDLGKEVTTKVRDAGVHLDKALLDRLAGPLAHLFRNAIDHGLEGAAERAAAGKPRIGCISLTAEPREGMVSLTLADDGRGIDPEAVRARAVELGLVGEAESRALGPAEIFQLLFLPGVSTRRTVTETSGRGIGLDAVKRDVEHLGGHVRIHAEVGRGTTVELRLPVSIALTRVLVIRLGDMRLGMPSAALSAVVSASADDLEEVHHRPTLRVGDERLPLVELAALLGEAVPMAEPAAAIQAIVVGEPGRRVALAVTGWEDDQDVVVKPLGELLEAARLFAGACLLESGELTLVLNPATVMAQALEADLRAGWRSRRQRGAAAQRRKQRILFAEDSAVTRAMILRVLDDLGYQVTVARDGKEALELLKERGADLVLTDLDMPVMSGLELVRRVRGEAAWRGLPILVLSTRAGPVDRQRALEAGADDYLQKGEGWEAALSDALRRRLEPPS